MSSGKTGRDGNDTIDPYPLIPVEAGKILCITLKTYAEIKQTYKTFRNSIKSKVQRIIVEPPRPSEAPLEVGFQRDYEPTKAISCNDSDWRRWVRVKEWFNEYGPDAEICKGSLLIK